MEDAGLYRITLENDFGRVEAVARLDVISHKGKYHTGKYTARSVAGLDEPNIVVILVRYRYSYIPLPDMIGSVRRFRASRFYWLEWS